MIYTLENMINGPSPGNMSVASKSRKPSKKAKEVVQKRCLSKNDIMTFQNDSYRQPAGKKAAVEVSEEREHLDDSVEQPENIDPNGQSLGVGVTAQVSAEIDNHGDTNDQTGGNTVDWNVTIGERLIAVPAPPSAQVNVSSSGVRSRHVAYGAHDSYYGTVDTGGVGSSGGPGSTDVRSGSPVNTSGSDRTSLWRGSGTGLGANRSRQENHFPQ